MPIYEFNVTQTETYSKRFSIDAEDKEIAIKELKNKLDQFDISEEKNTYDGKDTEIILVKIGDRYKYEDINPY